MKTFLHFFPLGILLLFCSTFGFFWLSELNITLSIFMFFLVFFYFWNKTQNSIFATCFYVCFPFFALYNMSMLIRDKTHQSKCFIFNQSYPGITEYDQCIKSLKKSDYVSEIFKL